MAESISIRVTRDLPSPETMDAAAQKLGMSRNQLITMGVDMMCSFDADFYDMINRIATKHKMTTPHVMQCMLIRRIAEDAAKADVWGAQAKVLPEFTQTSEGPLGAKELYDMLYQSAHQDEGRECAKQLQEDKNRGLALNEHETAILKKYGYKPLDPDRHSGASEAHWEGEPGYAKMTEGV